MATETLYVLPEDVNNVTCPFQPCATLNQYLMDKGSLPILSDVEYRFLPGDHHVTTTIQMWGATNFSLIGVGLSPVNLVCFSQSYYVAVFYSYNVTIKNLAFLQCNGILTDEFDTNVAASLILKDSFLCKVEDVTIWGHGFLGFNLFVKSHLNNIIINTNIATFTVDMCSQKFFLVFANTEYSNYYPSDDYILINGVTISGYSRFCYYSPVIKVQLI